MKNRRIVRVPIPISLIRKMDQLIVSGTGGYETREEFINDAIENHVLEMTYETAPGNLNSTGQHQAELPKTELRGPDRVGAEDSQVIFKPIMTSTVLEAPSEVTLIRDGIATVRAEPLIGLHNRDYPSIWVAHQLAGMTQSGPIRLKEFEKRIIASAWRFGSQLVQLQRDSRKRLTYLFPTNRKKPRAAETYFKAFAIGSIREEHGKVEVTGPLFLWRLCQLEQEDGSLLGGLTQEGLELLHALAGITVESPHTPDHSEIFLAHLKKYAEPDWEHLRYMLTLVKKEPTREQLLKALKTEWPNRSQRAIQTDAAGYISRAREWGLVEPRLVDSRYHLTTFGRNQVEEA